MYALAVIMQVLEPFASLCYIHKQRISHPLLFFTYIWGNARRVFLC